VQVSKCHYFLRGHQSCAKNTRHESNVPSLVFSSFGIIACDILVIYTIAILLITAACLLPALFVPVPLSITPDVANLKSETMTTENSKLVHHLGYADSLNVAISICLTYTLIFTCVRIHLRRSSFGADDAVVIVATMAAMAHFAASYACLTAGLGKPYDMIKGNLDRLNSVRRMTGRPQCSPANSSLIGSDR
jgi:hypothetical protein